MTLDQENYDHIHSGGAGYHLQERGLIAVWGKEAVQFLDGMITNDMKTLDDGHQMLAAFPNAQGRLLAVVRVLRQGDRFLIETEEATREKVFQNLFRFTFAGDFYVEDLSGQYKFADIFNANSFPAEGMIFDFGKSKGVFLSSEKDLDINGAVEIDDELYETLRIENGVPKYGIDMDETTIVPELGLDGMISYNKGCYIGQEIIARIYFRGHVAKRLSNLSLSDDAVVGGELTTADGKNAGRITSVTYSPAANSFVALGFVRYDYLAPETELEYGKINVKVVTNKF